MCSLVTKTYSRFGKHLKFYRQISYRTSDGTKEGQDLSFFYPRYESPFSVDLNPNYSQWMDRYCNQWAIFSSGQMGRDDKYRNAISKSDCGLFAAVTYPTADWHRIEKLMKWSLIFFICDDYHDMCCQQNRHSSQVNQFWSQIIDCVDCLNNSETYPDMSGWPQIVRAVHQILQEIYFDYSRTQIKRSVNQIKDYINGNVGESEWTAVDSRSASDQLPDWDTYWKARLGSVGGQMALQLIEYSLDIELSDEEYNDPSLQQLIRLVSEEIVLVNDYYTFRKEVVDSDGNWQQMKHSFPILVKQGLTLQEAVNRVNQMIKDRDKMILNQIKLFIDRSNTSDVVKKFVEGINHFVGGYWRHAVTARRYHGLDFGGVIPLSGRFIYRKDRTLIESSVSEPLPKWFTPIPQKVHLIIDNKNNCLSP